LSKPGFCIAKPVEAVFFLSGLFECWKELLDGLFQHAELLFVGLPKPAADLLFYLAKPAALMQ